MTWLAIFLVLVGTAVVGLASVTEPQTPASQIQHTPQLWGDVLALFSALFTAFYLVIGRQIRHRFSIIPYIWIMYGFGALTGCVVMLVTQSMPSGNGTAYFWLIISVIFPQILGHGAANYVLAYLPATLVSLVIRVSSLSSAFIAFLVFHEEPHIFQIIGGIPIVIGVTLAMTAKPVPVSEEP